MATKITKCPTCGKDIKTHTHKSKRRKAIFVFTEKECFCDLIKTK